MSSLYKVMDTQAAVDQLNRQLPLKARQDGLSPLLKALHQSILRGLAKRATAPSSEEMARLLGDAELASALQTLASLDLVVLNADKTAVLGAYPLTVETTPHQISLGDKTLYAMCALDAVSVAPMFATEVTINSRCHVTGETIQIRMRDRDILMAEPADVMVGIRWQMPSGSAAHSMCTEMVFLKDLETARQWQGDELESIALFCLSDAIDFGAAFFMPLLED